MKSKTIGVVGYGYVGKAVVDFFSEHYKVWIYDPAYKANSESPHFIFKNEVSDLDEVDLLVIAVPTPMKKDGSCDTKFIEETMKNTKAKLILIKSTVPPGTTDSMTEQFTKNIVFSPEFAGESKYWSPYKFDTRMVEMPYYIFGGRKELTSKIVDFYMKVGGPTKSYLQTDTRTAEMVKYMENAFYAAKVTLCQELYEICNVLRIDYNEARALWLLDPRINPMHTAVFADNRGFGGKCFPKDTNALVKFAEKAGYDAKLFKQVLRSNKKFISKNK